MLKFNLGKGRITAIDDTIQVGYLDFHYPNDKSAYRNIEIDYIFVHPVFRRQKIATKMINYFLDLFDNKVTWVSLWTGLECEVDQSYKLYPSLGFKELAYQEDYYYNGVGTRLYTKRIS